MILHMMLGLCPPSLKGGRSCLRSHFPLLSQDFAGRVGGYSVLLGTERGPETLILLSFPYCKIRVPTFGGHSFLPLVRNSLSCPISQRLFLIGCGYFLFFPFFSDSPPVPRGVFLFKFFPQGLSGVESGVCCEGTPPPPIFLFTKWKTGPVNPFSPLGLKLLFPSPTGGSPRPATTRFRHSFQGARQFFFHRF